MVYWAHMHAFTPFYSPYMPGFMSLFIPFLFVITLWTIVLKGFALWYAARGAQKGWFIPLLIVNTLGILEIIYLIWFRPKNQPAAHDDAPVQISSSAH